MKNVRVFFTKTDRLKFISHLDMNRFMIRILYKSGLPIWFTEGYNPHPYLTFALPLSLGFQSKYEVMDIRVTEDEITNEEIKEKLSAACPEYIEIFKVCEPILKPGKVAFAEFEIVFDTLDNEFLSSFSRFLNRESIMWQKKTKRGNVKEFDIAKKIKSYSIEGNTLKIILPAGSEDNINPTLILDAFYDEGGTNYYCYDIIRTKILDSDCNLFV